MPYVEDPAGALRQNLVDAGCGPEIVRQCMVLVRKQDQGELMRVLSRHRRALLDTLHQSERQIDCLDYLVHQMEKKAKERPGGISYGRKTDFDTGMGQDLSKEREG